ncbi:MAG: hypothetical protein EBZ59_10945, partial [Planctomycetia bacterium]|nr:hypothetical protein [Planctomycetia bacterium]
DGRPAAAALGAGWQSRSLGGGFFALTTPGASVADVRGWASRTPGIRGVEPDRMITGAVLPNDPSFGRLHGLDNSGQTGGVADADIDAPEAWNTTTGSRSVVVAVIDSGVDYRHPDLAANIWTNPGEVPGDGRDNDGNGYVDDVRGWDFANNDSDPFDDQGHGTHVAGTIGAVGNNGTGVVGVNWQVSIMPLKFLGADGSGTTSAAIAAINYATMMRRSFGVNVVATNNSWGGGGFSTGLQSAIAAGGSAGILFVAAAGNDGANNDTSPSYPASYTDSSIIAVAAVDSSGRLASFSNVGATSVDVAAPGVGILSTTPTNTYSSYSGTSMATPHVTGVAALLKAAVPAATSAQIRSAILAAAVPSAGLAGKVATGGVVNAAAALATLTETPPGVSPPATPPTADVIDVSPDPRTTSVAAVVVRFDRAVSGFDATDVSLVRDGVAVPLAGVSVTTADNIRWTVAGLDAATASAGTYTLTVDAADSGIMDAYGMALAAPASDSWTTRVATLLDAGNTLATAAVVGIRSGEIRLAGIVGDGGWGSRDVDMYAVTLAAGQSLVIDIDAVSLSGSSSLDSYLRVFDARGRQVAVNDDSRGSLDSYLAMRAMSGGTFYVGVSGYGNRSYSPVIAGSGSTGSTGVYQLRLAFSSIASPSMQANRLAGSRDPAAPPSTSAMLAAFAAYGINWEAALPAATTRARRACG